MIKEKYKCLDLGIYEENYIIICFWNESEIISVDFNFFHLYKNSADEEKFDELYYPVYDMDGRNQKLIRNVYKHF